MKFNSCTSDGAVTGGTSVDAMVGYADADIESNIQYADCTVNGTKYSKTTQLASNGAEEKQVVMDASEGKKEAETMAGTMGQPDETENAVTDADTQDLRQKQQPRKYRLSRSLKHRMSSVWQTMCVSCSITMEQNGH